MLTDNRIYQILCEQMAKSAAEEHHEDRKDHKTQRFITSANTNPFITSLDNTQQDVMRGALIGGGIGGVGGGAAGALDGGINSGPLWAAGAGTLGLVGGGLGGALVGGSIGGTAGMLLNFLKRKKMEGDTDEARRTNRLNNLYTDMVRGGAIGAGAAGLAGGVYGGALGNNFGGPGYGALGTVGGSLYGAETGLGAGAMLGGGYGLLSNYLRAH